MKKLEERWLVSQAMRDSLGIGDIAYVSVGFAAIMTLGSIPFILLMSAWEFGKCVPLIKPDVIVQCFYRAPGGDIALIAGAFSTALVALAAYMAATRKPSRDQIQNINMPNASGASQTQNAGDAK